MPQMSDEKPSGRSPGYDAAIGLHESCESPQKADAKIKDAPSPKGSCWRGESDSER